MDDASAAAHLGFDAVIFDMDGVVTRTAELHASAWKELFDHFLRARVAEGNAAFQPFDSQADYLAYVDGRPRHEGVRAFLAARGLQVVEGTPTDGPAAMTVQGLAAHKDALFIERMRSDGVSVFESTVALLRSLRERGVKTAVVTSSRNGREVLRVADVEGLFDVRLDGIDAAVLGLNGKPHPDPFLRASGLLGVQPGRATVIEDAASGVEAGRRGGFGLVVGVDRGGNRDALMSNGADFVVDDLHELDIAAMDRRVREKREAVLAWVVEQEGFDAAREHGMESIFTVGNGYLGVRGALDTPLPGAHGDLFVAGVYDKKSPSRPYSELEFIGDDRGDYAHSELVSAPFPFRLRLAVDGVPLEPTSPLCRTHRRTLDLRRGTLHGYADYDTGIDRRVVVRTRRCASLADLHLLVQEVSVMTARGAAAEEAAGERTEFPRLIGHVAQAVIERCAVPVLLLPRGYREALPWERLLVPVSGGAESDAALAFAVRLAKALGLSVYVAHVADADSKDEFGLRVRYSDELHFEYAAQLEELIARAIPTLASHERRCIQGAALAHGDVAGELTQLMKGERVSALVVGWHGQFANGRAEVLKHLLLVLDTPLLFVKSAGPSAFRLKVGVELE